MASKIHHLLKKSVLINSTNISSLLNKHHHSAVVSFPRREKQGFQSLNFSTKAAAAAAASEKIHLFKKSAIEAGNPKNYYLNPSDNLMAIPSDWSVVEHEDVINLTVNLGDFGNETGIGVKGRFITIDVESEDKEKAARADHKDGLKNFSMEMNPNFLDLGVTGDDIKAWEGIARLYIAKLKPGEIKKYNVSRDEDF